MQELKPEIVVCPLQPVVAKTYVDVVADPAKKMVEHGTHTHVDVVVPNAFVVVDVPTHVPVVHDVQTVGVMMAALTFGAAGKFGTTEGVTPVTPPIAKVAMGEIPFTV
jgi:hypothetical protein